MLSGIIDKIKHGIYRDFILSLLASAITTVAAQIVTYPLLAKLCSAEDYGRILTVMGIGNVIVLAFGNSLNNVRLVMNSAYEEKQLQGDFLPILSLTALLGTAAFGLYLLLSGEPSALLILSLCLFSLFGIVQAYGSVAFRIRINYVRNLWLSVWIAAGNLLGLGVFYLTHDARLWALTFVLGQLAGILFIHFRSEIFREGFRSTPLLGTTVKKETIILLSTMSANLLVYLDRLLLYPLLGGEAVSTYTVASFFGKSLAILMNPISGVLLTYYAQRGYRMDRKRFWGINGLSLLAAGLFMLCSLVLSGPITGFLYPGIIEQASPYLFIANLAAVINVLGNMVSPAVLKFAPTAWQAINQIIYMVVYLGLGIAWSRTGGLAGFAYAALIAAAVRVAVFYAVGHVSLRKE